jgi:hypothetical protein
MTFDMRKPSQQSFALASDEFKSYWKKSGKKTHGGVYALGKRKTARPFDSKKPVHLVMRSTRAKGPFSFLSPLKKNKVDQIVHEYARRFGVKIYDYSNNGNHLHLNIKAPNRRLFQNYLRTVSGLIARHVLGAKKGSPRGKFWDAPAFSRVAEWGKSFGDLRKYIYINVLEGAGIIPRDRETFQFVRIDSTA